jgi:hypothetical protein
MLFYFGLADANYRYFTHKLLLKYTLRLSL